MKKVIQWAAREKRRQVNDAVGRSFLKTITEPLTNADSILKKQAGVPHATGLINELLKLKVGERVNTAEMKGRLNTGKTRKIKVDLTTAGPENRLCRVIDAGTGMNSAELAEKFGTYASAKAKGEKTRSLFGRGALDVLLYHDDSVIYSVKDSVLSRCKIYWTNDTIVEIDELGQATKALLQKHHLPLDILHHGTVVEFALKEGTRIPYEDQIISKMSSFYMLRLIAADPNTEVEVRRIRTNGPHTDPLEYDFPLGDVLGRFDDTLDLGSEGHLPVAILVARSDVALESDPQHIERRENGLLFVDDNDAVLDLTLLPDYERTPYLGHIFGIVRITGLRQVLETHLEAEDAEAVLTTTRDGFDRRNELAKRLFSLVERHVKPLYETEEQRERKGNSKRSEALDQRINDALKAINKFNAEETEDDGDGDKPVSPRPDAIYFSAESARLYAGMPRRVSVFINHDKINDGEIVLFESDHDEIKVEPDSTVAKVSKKQPHQVVHLTISSDVKGLRGKITALSLDKSGKEVRAELRILAVEDPPIIELPEDIAFTAPRYNGDPNRPRNNAALLVNLERFSGMPTITFVLDEVVGKVTLSEGQKALDVKVTQQNVIPGHRVARLLVPFSGTGWGQNAVLRARVKCSDGKNAEAKCKLRFEKPLGDQKFSDFLYEDLDRPVLGDVAGDKLYVNAGYALHREIFGDTEADFHRSLEDDSKAQIRAVSVLVETAVYHTATTKIQTGGRKGLHINPDDPIGSLRPYIDESKMKLEPKIYQALVK